MVFGVDSKKGRMMYTLGLWRCSSCPRILGRDLRLGDGSDVRAVCWGCGAMNLIPEPEATGGYAFAGEGASELAEAVRAKLVTVEEVRAAGLLATTSATKPPKGKMQEAVGSDGGFAVKGQ